MKTNDFTTKQIKEIKENLTPLDIDNTYFKLIGEVYGETVKIGWGDFATTEVLKKQDPIGWRCDKHDYIDGLVQDGGIVSFDNDETYYWVHEIEEYFNKKGEIK